MRDAYHEELAAITQKLLDTADLVRVAVDRATEALLAADVGIAEAVIDGDDAVDSARADIERRGVDLMARQQPVAGDLRALVASQRMASDLERAGDFAVHLATLARRRFPAPAVPVELRDLVRRMGAVAGELLAKAGRALADRDPAAAGRLESDDDVMDELNRAIYQAVLAPGWPYGVDTAIDLSQVGRYYERCADHVVSVARQVVYLVTGDVVSH